MQPIHFDALESYCLRCQARGDEKAPACWRCGTDFAGSGAFDRVLGPPPSALFAELFGSRES